MNAAQTSSPSADERYAFKPFYGSSHWWALGELGNLSPSSRILDIGVGDGMLAAELTRRGCSQIFGIEIDPQARERAAPHYRDIVDTPEKLDPSPFDVVLMLDVLEHMTTPFEFYQQILQHLRPGGLALISVPNVAHWSVRFQLLLGMWVYTKRGLLDETHYHFFTRKHFRELLATRSDVELICMDSSISPAEFALPSALTDNPLYNIGSRARLLFARFFPGLCAYQHLAILRRRAL